MTKKALIFDFDGTAIDSPTTQVPTQRVVRAIANAQTKYFMCGATGRVWSFAQPVISSLNLVDPCIVAAGTQIRDPQTAAVLWQKNINPPATEAIVATVKELDSPKFFYNDYTTDEYFHRRGMPADAATELPVHFAALLFVPENEAPPLTAKFAHISGIACTRALSQRPGFNDLLFTDAEATKQHAVERLVDILGINQRDTTGVGDGHNDIDLFEAVHHRVAMGNAVDELKQRADEIIGDVTDDGLARYLEGVADT